MRSFSPNSHPTLAAIGLAAALLAASCSGSSLGGEIDEANTTSPTTTQPSAESTTTTTTATEGSTPTSTTPDGPAPTTAPPRPPITVTPQTTGDIDAPGFIAYASIDGELVVDRPNTGTLDPGVVSALSTFATQPTWSPDGNQLAWVSLNQSNRLAQIELYNVVQGTGQALTPTFIPFFLSWAPSSDNVGLLGGSGTGADDEILFGFSAAQDVNVIPVSDRGSQYFFSWLPDGSSVVGHDGDELRVAVADGAEAVQDSNGAFQVPVVLPTDADEPTRIALSVDDPGLGSILAIVEIDSGAVTPLATHDGVTFIVASPDGSTLAVLSSPNPTGGPAINPISFQQTTTTTPPTTTQSEPIIPGELPELAQGLSVVDLETGTVTDLRIENALTAFFSPDSTRLLIQAGDETSSNWLVLEGEQIVLQTAPFTPTPTWTQTVVPFFDQYHQSMTPWSPNSEAFVFSRINPTGSQIVIHAATDGRLNVVGSGDYAVWSPTP